MATALSATELNRLRTASGHHRTKAYLSVVTPTTIGTAQINQTTFTNPIAQLTIDNTSANFTSLVKKGMTVWIGTTAGARDVGVFRVRKTPLATTLYVGEFAKGDMGRVNIDTLRTLANNYHITVVDDHFPDIVYSRIAFNGSGSGTFYKDYDIAYANQTNTTGTPVQLNIGDHVAGFASGSSLSVSKTATIKAFSSGVTVSSYSWSIGDGTFTSGTSASQSWTATFPVGQRWIRCTVTLSNGTTVTAWRCIIVHDTSTNVPLEVRVQSDHRTLDGRQLTLELSSDTLQNTNIPKGSMLIFWEDSVWDDGDISEAIDQFVGWAFAVDSTSANEGRSTIVQAASAFEILKNMGFVSQELVVAASPAKWSEVVYQLSHTDYYCFYLMYWHTELLSLFDFFPTGGYNDYKYQAWSSNTGNLPGALNENLARLNAYVGQSSKGAIYSSRHPNYMTTAERTALTTLFTCTEADITEITATRQVTPSVGQVRAYGSSYNGSKPQAFVAYAPGTSRGVGQGVETLEGQLVDTQAELNRRAANHYARMNNPLPRITLTFTGNYDVFNLPDVSWLQLNIAAGYWSEGIAYNERVIPTEVNVSYGDNGEKIVTLTVEGEVDGSDAPGQKIPVVIGNDTPPGDIPIPPINPDTGEIVIVYDPYGGNPPIPGTDPDDFPIPDEDDQPGQRVVFAWGDSKVARMFPDRSPEWEVIFEITDTTNHLIVDAIIDQNSPRLTTDPIEGDIRLWVSVGQKTISGTTEDGLLECTNALSIDPSFSVISASPRLATLRQSIHAVETISGLVHRRFIDFVGSTADQTQTVNGNSSTTVQIEGGVDFSQLAMQVVGTINAGSYQYDACFRSSDNWSTYERYNTFEIDGQLLRPANVTYSSSHTYIFNVRDVGTGAYYNIRFLDPDGSWGANTGSWTVSTFEAFSLGGDLATSEDAGATWDEVGQTADLAMNPDYGMDVNDYEYAVVACSSNRFFVATILTDTDPLVVTTPANSNATTVLVRIPYKTIAGSPVANDDITAMHWIYASNAVESGSTHSIWKGVVDVTNATNGSETGITPTIDSIKTICMGANSVEMLARNPNVMAGWFERLDGSGGSHLLLSTTGGSSWSEPNSNIGHGSFFIWETSQAAWAAGTDGQDSCGALYTPDRWATAYDYTLNWEADVENLPIKGVRVAYI